MNVSDPVGDDPPDNVALSLSTTEPTVPPADGVVLIVGDALVDAGCPHTR